MSAADFTQAEYDDRLARVRAAMEAAGIETLIVTDPSNMAWLTGYDGWSFYVHQAVLLGLAAGPFWWGRGIDLAGAHRTVFMGDECCFGYADSFVQNPEAHPMEDLSHVAKDLRLSAGRIGIEMDNYYFSAKAYTALLTHLSKNFADATGLVNWCRAIKSPQEMTYIRRAARIVEAMHATIADRAVPGIAKNDLVAEIYRTGIKGVDGHFGDYPAIVPMAPSGRDATAAHLTWDGSPMKEGEATFFEIAGCHRRYHCPQSRTVFLGKPPDKYRRAEAAIAEATEAALDVARPGQTCADVARAFNRTLASHGFRKDNRCGYSIGLSYPPDWGERTMSFREADQTELEPGMVFHFMPALWLDDGGLETTEPIAITEGGAERLCATPAGMIVKDS